MKHAEPEIAVVIPCYQCRDHIGDVLARIGSEVAQIVVVDDACPEGTGKHVEAIISSCPPPPPRVTVLYQDENTGVGGAVLRGMSHAREAGADVMVKIDGDGQMEPELVERFVAPIWDGEADYTKGNRFYSYRLVKDMPFVRLLGNGILSFLTKLSSGYWNVFDPANGYIAISGRIFDELPLDGIHRRYSFETDMLCQLSLLRAVVMDIPTRAIYGEERSGLSPIRLVAPLLGLNMARFFRRVAYNYFLRDFSIGSLNLLIGIPLLSFGLIFGVQQWITVSEAGLAASAGTVMLAALPVILGFVLVLNFFLIDVMMVPKDPLHPRLMNARVGLPVRETTSGNSEHDSHASR